jgi:hypothetical protein
MLTYVDVCYADASVTYAGRRAVAAAHAGAAMLTYVDVCYADASVASVTNAGRRAMAAAHAGAARELVF